MGVLRGSGLTVAGTDSLQGVLVQACSRRSGQVLGLGSDAPPLHNHTEAPCGSAAGAA